ncbi:hypothetical protein SDC9_127079 [bioreactor metagenome]|uniref:Uncharacterized protein n=1 Tax=bioreactor metagenome TaxID=1076179 RepID=A0A645CT15_9ZZZZ
MYDLFELRKHGLTVNRSPELLQVMIEQIDLLLFILGILQQIINQQGFVYRGSHLRHKYGILVINIGLVMA